MINYNIGIQLTKNSEKYLELISYLQSKKNVSCFHISSDDILKEVFSSLDILVTHRMNNELFSYATDRLKWIHFGSAGIESSLFPEILNSKTIITNSSGIHADSVSEFVIACMLYFTKQFQDCNKFYQIKKWTQWDIARKMQNLKGKTIGIIGYGSIGKAIGTRAKAFGMRIIGTRRLQKKIENKKTIDYLIPFSEVNFLLEESDYVVISCPLTPLTKNMIGKNELSKMKKTSYLINIARGSIIDENSLIEMLKKKKIAGAALDVFDSEPLSNKSPLFNLKNVFLSPHISGNFPNYNKMVMDLFNDNFERFENKKSLKNRVCKKRLY